ncbi:hypothetical protein BKA70DRAFT_1410548 [Coprinopsis sp. MPI-PUGE-AT-0042]|nr:hypothetical protein BKA70DRAFT_1410548 [Coprinopsis sp. MPI-PUGE-AT-0042]
MAHPISPPNSPALRDEGFYWDPVVFLVEGLLFKVPKDRLSHGSDYFSKQYLEHNLSGGPIQLDVTAEEFRVFLQVLYPRPFHRRMDLTKVNWISLLKLSTLWHFNGLRGVAITRLEAQQLQPAEKVSLGKQYYVSRWVITGYDALVRNEEVISVQDATQLGIESTVGLYICREQRRYESDPNYLENTFKDQLIAIAEQEVRYTSGSTMEGHDGGDPDAEERCGTDEVSFLREKLRQLQSQLEERLAHSQEQADAQKTLEKALEDLRSTSSKEKQDCASLLALQMMREAELQKQLDEKEVLAAHLAGIQTNLQKQLSEAQSSLSKQKKESEKAASTLEKAHSQTRELLEQQTKLWEAERQNWNGSLAGEKAMRQNSDVLVTRLRDEAGQKAAEMADLEARLRALTEAAAETQNGVHIRQQHTSDQPSNPTLLDRIDAATHHLPRRYTQPESLDSKGVTRQFENGEDDPVNVPYKRSLRSSISSPHGTSVTSGFGSSSQPQLPAARRKKVKTDHDS